MRLTRGALSGRRETIIEKLMGLVDPATLTGSQWDFCKKFFGSQGTGTGESRNRAPADGALEAWPHDLENGSL